MALVESMKVFLDICRFLFGHFRASPSNLISAQGLNHTI